ncbi:hypothetical protein BDAP_000746 [Binucleata daphniae]
MRQKNNNGHKNKCKKKFEHKLVKSKEETKVSKKIPYIKIEEIKKITKKIDDKKCSEEINLDIKCQKIKTSKIVKESESEDTEKYDDKVNEKKHNRKDKKGKKKEIKHEENKQNTKIENNKDEKTKNNGSKDNINDTEYSKIISEKNKHDIKQKKKDRQEDTSITSNLFVNSKKTDVSKRVTFAENIQEVKHIPTNNDVAIKSKKKRKHDSHDKNKKQKTDDNINKQEATKKQNNENTKTASSTNKHKNISENEQKLLKHGTKKDQVNVLALIIEKNPNNCKEELLELINKCNDERNDFVVFVLRNIKNLLLSNFKFDKDTLICKKRLVNIFEIYLKNVHVKQKVIEIMYSLLKNNVMFVDLIYMFINKLGDKQTCNLVIEHLKEMYESNNNRKLILFGLEELYYKDYKTRKIIVNFVNRIKDEEKEQTELYKIFYDNLKSRDFTDKSEFEKTLHNIVKGMIKNIDYDSEVTNDKVECENTKCKESAIIHGNNLYDENLLLHIYKSWQLNFDILKLLKQIKSKNFTSQLVRTIKGCKFYEMKNKDDFYLFVYNYIKNETNDAKMIICIEALLSAVIHTNYKYIIEVLILASKVLHIKKYTVNDLYALSTLQTHYHPIIRILVAKILDKQEISDFNPNSCEDVERMIMQGK